MEALWSELPSDLLNAIDAQLVYIDKVRVRVICVSWNSRLPKMPNHKLPQLPWLFQAFVNNKEASHGLFNLHEKKFYQLDLPEAQGRLFKGSSHGWVLMIAYEDICASSPDIYLINPLTRVQIQLPPRYTFPDVEDYCADRVGEEYCLLTGDGLYYGDSNCIHLDLMEKVVTSCIPSSEDCVVVAIYGEFGRLAWCTRNHKKWIPLDLNIRGPVEDVIFYKNKLHALNCHGHVLEVENIGPNPKVTLIAPPPPLRIPSSKDPMDLTADHRYLVECSDGSLIMVGRYFDDLTYGFKVYKLDSMNSSWLVVNNIGNDMLFLGFSLSFSVSSGDFPGYRGNRIYFANDPLVLSYNKEKRGDSDIGVFNLEDRSIERLPGFTCVPRFLWPPPVWVTPPSYH